MTTVVITDTETAGLKPPASGSGLVEFAYLKVDLQTLEVQDEFVTRINPMCEIDPGASAVHGVYAEDVAHSPELHYSMMPYPNVVAVCHNAQFDMRFLMPHMPQIQSDICTLRLARRHIKGPANYKLTTLAQFLNLPEQKAHSALGDCYYVHGLLKELLRLTGKSLLELEERSNTAAVFHTMPFGKYMGKSLNLVPTPYLQWFKDQDIDQDLRKTIELQLKAR
jgi:DNA polymerase III epsilon subunit-like protein